MTDHASEEPIHSELVQQDPGFADVVSEFVAGLDRRLRAMQEAAAQVDFHNLRSLAHQLKGAGGGHGYAILTEVPGALEEQALAKQIDTCRQYIDELTPLVKRVEAGVEPTERSHPL